ncbi:hypothetical protein UA08_00753 [Talaromyces atroroseus]|uniref:RecA family profile 1 domain-containing protein n=1 Tax=Talaromyces atroroseus TaxID=1441469 RepID=A0A225B257_TALAT|nr:hypothetical protein UA08_00753 [Talaromyces atroroseus]OKL63798.1 hypothetical protein UA08_00753 [Talaromyces atroroseus]
MDLLTILPTFVIKPYTHILPSLERRNISTVDLITLDYLEIAKRAHVPPADVRRLCADVVAALHGDLDLQVTSDSDRKNKDEGQEADSKKDARAERGLDLARWNTVTTLDPALDKLLGGGIPTGYLTEVTGESGSGKTQFLLNLLLAAQLPAPKGLGKRAIYISTEAPLSTPRLSQILQTHPFLSQLPANETPSLDNVLSITAVDLETQDHILNYQLPVAISRFNVGLVAIDSIAANYRAEHASNSMQGLSARSGELARLGHMLRNLAVREDVAIVVANQVSDRFDNSMLAVDTRFSRSSQTSLLNRATHNSNNKTIGEGNDFPSSSPALSSTPSSQLPADDDAFVFDGAYIVGHHPVRNETLSLAHQQKFFTGWGDEDGGFFESQQKTPALGFVWSTQIACRIALKKDDESADNPFRISALSTQPSFQVSHPQGEGNAVDKENNHSTEIKSAGEVSLQSSPSQNKGSNTPTHHEEKDPSLPLTKAPSKTPTKVAERRTKRRIKLVFAPWTSGIVHNDQRDTGSNEIEFEIWKGGIRSLANKP